MMLSMKDDLNVRFGTVDLPEMAVAYSANRWWSNRSTVWKIFQR